MFHFHYFVSIVAENLLFCSGCCWETSVVDGARLQEGAFTGSAALGQPILPSTHPAYWKPPWPFFTNTGGDKKNDQTFPVWETKSQNQGQTEVNSV